MEMPSYRGIVRKSAKTGQPLWLSLTLALAVVMGSSGRTAYAATLGIVVQSGDTFGGKTLNQHQLRPRDQRQGHGGFRRWVLRRSRHLHPVCWSGLWVAGRDCIATSVDLVSTCR